MPAKSSKDSESSGEDLLPHRHPDDDPRIQMKTRPYTSTTKPIAIVEEQTKRTMREGLTSLSQAPALEVVDSTVAVAGTKRPDSTPKKAKSSKSGDRQSRASRKKKNKQQKKEDVDAARHLRLVLQYIKEDQTIDPSDKRETIDRFNALLKKVEADNRKANRQQQSRSGSKSSSFIVEYPTKTAHSSGRLGNEVEARNDTEEGRLAPSSNSEASGGRDEARDEEYREEAPKHTVVRKEPKAKQKPSKMKLQKSKSTKKAAPQTKKSKSTAIPDVKTSKSTGQKPKRKSRLIARLFGKSKKGTKAELKKSTKAAEPKEPSRTERTAERNQADPSSTFEPKLIGAGQDFADAFDDDDKSQADSIMDVREANSDHYAESVCESICSVRSLNTFEKDFINAIVNHGEDDSVHTFEEDMKTKVNAPPPRPQEVVFDDGHAMQDDFDDLTVEGIPSDDSETTFEKDARKRAGKSSGITAPPKPSEFFMPKQHEVVANTSDCSFRSETTYEKDQRLSRERQVKLRPNESAQPAFRDFNEVVKKVSNIDSNNKVSLNQKDHRALVALAKKIGRVPSTRSRASYDGSSVGPMNAMSPTSAVQATSPRSPGNLFLAGAGKPPSAVHGTSAAARCAQDDYHRASLVTMKKEEEKDEQTVFEKDLMTHNLNGPGMQHHATANAGMSFDTKSTARGEEVQALPPKISPLAEVLSPHAVDKGTKKLEQGTMWDKLWSGGLEW